MPAGRRDDEAQQLTSVDPDEQLRLVIGKRLRDHFTNTLVKGAFGSFEGQALRLPDRHAPDAALLARHRQRFAATAA
jgi:hypothetical protein